MMNIQNPAPYPPQQAYSGYGNVMAQPGMQPSSYTNDFPQHQFQQPFPQTPQRPNHFPQHSGSQIPPHVYQQLQQQQQAFSRPQSSGNNGLIPGSQQRQSPSNLPGTNQTQNHSQNQPARTNAAPPPTSNPQIPHSMAMTTQIPQAMSNTALAQQAQIQNAAQQMSRPVQSQQAQTTNQMTSQQTNTLPNPQLASREKARVSILLDINSHLLQEVSSLQAQGKAGPVTQQPSNQVQQSPTSPTSAATENANTFSPTDSTPQNKAAGPPSQEYQECMRRLQANLSYLAAIADAKKRPDGKVPPYPAIISAPPHLKDVHELYRRLSQLFPEASQSKMAQAIAFASAQGGPGGQQQNVQQGLNTAATMGAGPNIGSGVEQ